jgi:hypothetical protein
MPPVLYAADADRALTGKPHTSPNEKIERAAPFIFSALFIRAANGDVEHLTFELIKSDITTNGNTEGRTVHTDSFKPSTNASRTSSAIKIIAATAR